MPNITVMMRAGGVSDCKDALAEAKRAKIISGGRNPVLATVEFLIANAKLALRPLRKAVGTFMNPNQ
jgi:hypothetical protein